MAATSYQDPGFAPASMPSPPRLQPALLGGLFIGVLSALPFVNLLNCCCLWVITGGMLAAYVMQQNTPYPISIGDGVIVGFGAGLVGGIVSFLLSFPLNYYLGPLMTGVYQGFVRNGRQDMPAEARHFIAQIGPRGVVIIGGLVFGMISLVFGTIGGMLGALFFRAPAPPAQVRPPVPPPAPPPPPAVPPDDVSII
jgi:hypothetical protein